jgi:hypothetical protein
VFCGQIAVHGGSGSGPIPADDQPTITLPGGFKPGNIDPKSLPVPLSLTSNSSSTHDPKNHIKLKSLESDTGDDDDDKDKDEDEGKQSSDSQDAKPKIASACGDRCFKKKLTELADLAPGCAADQTDCLCKSHDFVKAYQACCNDHCEVSSFCRPKS